MGEVWAYLGELYVHLGQLYAYSVDFMDFYVHLGEVWVHLGDFAPCWVSVHFGSSCGIGMSTGNNKLMPISWPYEKMLNHTQKKINFSLIQLRMSFQMLT